MCVVVCVAFALGYKYIPVNSYERAFAFFIAVFQILKTLGEGVVMFVGIPDIFR